MDSPCSQSILFSPYLIQYLIPSSLKKGFRMAMDRDFWDKMARNYPSFDHPQMGEDVRVILEQAVAFGVDFHNARILDIGCGTGTLAIPLAQMGTQVYAMDISPEMLRRLEADSRAAGVAAAITTRLSDWESFPLDAPYDIAVASMTPAVSTEAHFQKYIRAAGSWGIFVGWGSYKRNAFLEALMAAHGADYVMPPDKAARFYETVTALGKKAALGYFDTGWEDRYSPDDAKEYAKSHLERDGIVPDETIIREVIARWEKNGEVAVATRAQKGVVVWRA
jgi:SAM-dependent methyltransferase